MGMKVHVSTVPSRLSFHPRPEFRGQRMDSCFDTTQWYWTPHVSARFHWFKNLSVLGPLVHSVDTDLFSFEPTTCGQGQGSIVRIQKKGHRSRLSVCVG
jgi:hypothetical protein